ncbi:MAG: anti-sigma factor family protein, partial [Armatimonadota bacterium]
MQCFEIRELFRDYVDGALSKEDQQVLREHLARCSVCERELRMYDHVVVSLASLPPVEPPAGRRDRLHDAIEREADRQHA